MTNNIFLMEDPFNVNIINFEKVDKPEGERGSDNVNKVGQLTQISALH